MKIVSYIKFIVDVENAPHNFKISYDLPDVNTYVRKRKVTRTYRFIFRHWFVEKKLWFKKNILLSQESVAFNNCLTRHEYLYFNIEKPNTIFYIYTSRINRSVINTVCGRLNQIRPPIVVYVFVSICWLSVFKPFMHNTDSGDLDQTTWFMK